MKKQSLTRQLKQSQQNEAQLFAEVSSLKEKLKSAEGMRDYNSKRAQDAEQEIEQVHMLLDAVPNPPPRSGTDQYAQKFAPMTRLAAWLAGARRDAQKVTP